MNDTAVKIFGALIVVYVVVFLWSAPLFAFASATDDFESYTNGASVDGLSGGSGWSSTWRSDNSSTISNTVANGGALSLHDAASYGFATRYFSTTTVGTLTVYEYMNSHYDAIVQMLDETGAYTIGVHCNGSTFHYAHFGGTLDSGISCASSPQWWKIDIDFDVPEQGGYYRFRINDGIWSAWTQALTSFTGLAGVRLTTGGDWTGYSYWDDLTITLPVSGGGGGTTIAATTTDSQVIATAGIAAVLLLLLDLLRRIFI